MATAIPDPVLTDRTSREALQPLINCCIAFIILDTIFVAGRMISRFWIRGLPFWWDDFWILPAYLCNIGLCVIGLVMAKIEIHYSDIDQVILNPDELPPLLKSIYATTQLLLPAYALTRFSILALYLRIFSDKGVRLASWIVSCIIAAQWIAFAFGSFFLCSPVPYFWDRLIEGGHCHSTDVYYRSVTIPNIILDVVIIILPIPTVWQLRARRLRKVGLTFIFCFGTMALIASCIRLYEYETHTSEVLAPSLTNVLIAWCVVEPGIYLITACLPAMHHLFVAMTPQPVLDFIDSRLSALRIPLPHSANSGRRGTDGSIGGQSSQTGTTAGHSLYASFTKLSEGEHGPVAISETHNAHAEAANAGGGSRRFPGLGGSPKTEDIQLENGSLPRQGIVVTTEVIVTQEERIADVIGF